MNWRIKNFWNSKEKNKESDSKEESISIQKEEE